MNEKDIEKIKLAIYASKVCPENFKKYISKDGHHITYQVVVDEKVTLFIHKPEKNFLGELFDVIIRNIFLTGIERKYSNALFRQNFAFYKLEKHFKNK